MSKTFHQVALPVQFKMVQLLRCDGCGLEVGDDALGTAPRLGWLQQFAENEDGRGGIVKTSLLDFCRDCRPKIERAQKQEMDAIKAEGLAAKADVSGVA